MVAENESVAAISSSQEFLGKLFFLDLNWFRFFDRLMLTCIVLSG